tara:strand:- start:103 stop:1656 length:1554 start_codon:yes stop_codon:yes gene_type:complete
MSKKKKYVPLILLIAFSIFCSLIIGQSMDEENHLVQGKITLDYLFSLGQINNHIWYREFYSPIYWSLNYFITEIFPYKYKIETSHLVNLIFSLSAIFGIGKVCRELFNKKVGDLVFLILFFYPIFFGHMSINSKDTILAFSHVWIVYLILRYLKKQNLREKVNKYVIILGLLVAISTGIQLAFLGSQIPVFIFVLIEIFLLKKIINKNFSIKVFLYDLIKCFIVFYFILVLFWIDTHQNILIYPFYILQDFLSEDYKTGWPFNLINGNYYISSNVPSFYFLINFIFKSPEYILILYLFFFISFFKSFKFYKKKFTHFNYKILFVILMLIFPNIILYVVPFPIYDGMRLFLWVVPYYCIIPGLAIYYIIENLNFKIHKIILPFLLIFFAYHLFNFFIITPYQYTYLNILNGKTENRFKKFENDYWGVSIDELVKNANFETNEVIKISTCGISDGIPKQYFKKKLGLNYKFVEPDKANYIIMTNRVMKYEKTNCFEKYKGDDIVAVKRNGLILSVIRKI